MGMNTHLTNPVNFAKIMRTLTEKRARCLRGGRDDE